MKVKDLIDRLNDNYKSDDQLIVAYWDKSGVEGYAEVTLTDDQWTDLVAGEEIHEPIDLERYGGVLQDLAQEIGIPQEELVH